jgi:hypothetical protein
LPKLFDFSIHSGKKTTRGNAPKFRSDDNFSAKQKARPDFVRTGFIAITQAYAYSMT